MSKVHVQAVWECDLPHAQKSVATVIAWYTNPHTGTCSTSASWVARCTGYKMRQVHNIFGAMKDSGVLEVAGRRGMPNGHGYMPIYRLNLDGVPRLQRASEDLQNLQNFESEDLQGLQNLNTEDLQNLQDKSVQSAHEDLQFATRRPARIAPKQIGTVRTENIKPNKARKPGAHSFVIPDWVPRREWDAFVEMRKTIRKPLTQYACERVFEKLIQLRDAGFPPADVLNQSVLNCWQGLFELKKSPAVAAAAPNKHAIPGNVQRLISLGVCTEEDWRSGKDLAAMEREALARIKREREISPAQQRANRILETDRQLGELLEHIECPVPAGTDPLGVFLLPLCHSLEDSGGKSHTGASRKE